MAEVNRESGTVNARILYWGIAGAGKSANLRMIHQKLRPDHRGELQVRGTRLDPTVTYEVLPIELGDVGGMRTRIEIATVPAAPEHAPTRKQLLDRVDGIVFVVDARAERIDENLASFDELRRSLAAYGRSLDRIPLVIQYNKSDLSDPFALEELHKKLDARGAAAFEAVAVEGTAVLSALTTISKRVMRALREAPAEPAPARPPAAPAPVAPRPRGAGPPRASAPGASPAAPAAAPAAHPASAIEEAMAVEARHPGAARAAATAAAARAAFEVPRGEAGYDRTEVIPTADVLAAGEPLPEPAALEVESVGVARRAGPRAVRVPVVVRDGAGRRQALTLTIEIAPAGGDGEG
jgi:hypothetical protein